MPSNKDNYLKALPGSARTEGIQPTKAAVLSVVPIFQLRPTSVTRQKGRIPQLSDSREGRVLEKSPFTEHGKGEFWRNHLQSMPATHGTRTGKKEHVILILRNTRTQTTLPHPSNRKSQGPTKPLLSVSAKPRLPGACQGSGMRLRPSLTIPRAQAGISPPGTHMPVCAPRSLLIWLRYSVSCLKRFGEQDRRMNGHTDRQVADAQTDRGTPRKGEQRQSPTQNPPPAREDKITTGSHKEAWGLGSGFLRIS